MRQNVILAIALSLSATSSIAEVVKESVMQEQVVSSQSISNARGSFFNPKTWGEATVPGHIHRAGSGGYFESRFTGSASKLVYYYPKVGTDNANWFYRGMKPAGTFEAPLSWGQDAVIGSIHKSGAGPFYESRFVGNASKLKYYFPAVGTDNARWFYRGSGAGTYAQPRNGNEYAFVGSIHRSDSGLFYEARFNGIASSFPFPANGKDNSNWLYRGKHAGTVVDPKYWSDASYIGAIHRSGSDGPLYESKVDGVNRAYYPAVGTNNSSWTFKGLHAGTYTDPQSMGEPARVKAIFGRDANARYESKFSGSTSLAETPYPSEAERENQWWKLQALKCDANQKSAASVRSTARMLPVAPQDTSARRTIDIGGLVSGRSAVMRSELLANVRMPNLELTHQDERYEVRSANLLDSSKGHVVGEMIVVTRDDGSFVSILNAPNHNGVLEGRANGMQTWAPNGQDDFMGEDSISQEQVSARASSVNSQASYDCDGKLIVDVLAGFSESSAAYVRDPHAFGLAQMETANLGLRNSKIDVRLRLVGVQIISKDYGVTSDTLKQISTLFSSGITQYGADVVAGYFYPASGSSAGGMAYVPGRYNINRAVQPTAFRHELGHNAGGSHCNTSGSANYRFGYSRTGSTRSHKTFLCGNNTSFYSTPLLLDEDGHPRGDAKTADMARQWREHAPVMSAHMEAVTPVSGVIP